MMHKCANFFFSKTLKMNMRHIRTLNFASPKHSRYMTEILQIKREIPNNQSVKHTQTLVANFHVSLTAVEMFLRASSWILDLYCFSGFYHFSCCSCNRIEMK